MLTFLLSSFARLKTTTLLVTLGLLGLVALTGLSYKAGRSDGYELAQAKYLKSVDQSKDQVIEALRLQSEKTVEEIRLNRLSNQNLSDEVTSKFNIINIKLKDALNEPTVIDVDCRAGYAGTIGVFNDLATASSPTY